MKFETANQAAARLGVTVRAVQKWAKEGKLEGAQKIGRDWMIPFGVVATEMKVDAVETKATKKVFDVAFPMFQLPYFSGELLEHINKISDPVLLLAILSSPIYRSIATAIGVIVAHTTAFGSTADNPVQRRNQNTIWLLRLLPTKERNFAAMRRSSPVSSHDAVNIDAPKSNKIVSDA